MLGGVFISYRREDSAGFAGRIYDRLTRRLDPKSVFLDVDNIQPGLDFFDVLSEKLRICDALIAVIGKNWNSSADQDNRRRLDDPDDFVRIEIEAALQRGIRVIPVLVDGATMPRREDLPDSGQKLRRRQAIEISHNRFDSDVERLTHALSLIEEELRQREAAEAERAAREERERREVADAARAEEVRRKAEAEPLRRADEERQTREVAEAERISREERERQDAAEAARDEESRRLAEAEAVRREQQKREAVGTSGAPARLPRKWWSNEQNLVVVAAMAIVIVAIGGVTMQLTPQQANAPSANVADSTAAKPSVVTIRGADDQNKAPSVPVADSTAPNPSVVTIGGADEQRKVPSSPVADSAAKPSVMTIRSAGEQTKAPGALAALKNSTPNDDPVASNCYRRSDDNRLDVLRGQGAYSGLPQQAISACREALASDPTNPRIQYELASTLALQGSFPEAISLLREAANGGFAKAQVKLGALYQGGLGIARDDAQAMAWYSKAADQGDEDAKAALGRLRAK